MKPIDSKEVARLTQELDSLQQQVQEVHETYIKQREPLDDSVEEVKGRLAAAMSTFEVGDRVIWRDGTQTHKAVIAKIKYGYGRPEFFVRVVNKDGSIGKKVRNVWIFDRLDKVLFPDNLQAATVGGERVVPAVGTSGDGPRTKEVSTPMKRTTNPPVGWR